MSDSFTLTICFYAVVLWIFLCVLGIGYNFYIYWQHRHSDFVSHRRPKLVAVFVLFSFVSIPTITLNAMIELNIISILYNENSNNNNNDNTITAATLTTYLSKASFLSTCVAICITSTRLWTVFFDWTYSLDITRMLLLNINNNDKNSNFVEIERNNDHNINVIVPKRSQQVSTKNEKINNGEREKHTQKKATQTEQTLGTQSLQRLPKRQGHKRQQRLQRQQRQKQKKQQEQKKKVQSQMQWYLSRFEPTMVGQTKSSLLWCKSRRKEVVPSWSIRNKDKLGNSVIVLLIIIGIWMVLLVVNEVLNNHDCITDENIHVSMLLCCTIFLALFSIFALIIQSYINKYSSKNNLFDIAS